MKILVDSLPRHPSVCPFSKFHPYPPIVEEPGYYTCNLTGKDCSLKHDDGCDMLKVMEEK